MEVSRSRVKQVTLQIVIAVASLGSIAFLVFRDAKWPRRNPIETLSITGAVLRQNADPRKQSPIANAEVTATGGLFEAHAKSDASGLFELSLRPSLRSGEPITLQFEHSEYKPLEVTGTRDDRLYVVRMEPVAPEPASAAGAEAKALPIRDVRVRYTVKNQTTLTVGSVAKQFEVENTGNVPCANHRPCSPDGKWKATTRLLSLDAGQDDLFRNVRVTCIAGPCPFTRIYSGDLTRPIRMINVSVLNWSDSTTFLVEAEVTRTAVTDTIRRSFPTIIGQTMTFALPAAAEGPTVEANLNGEEIVFPLGPKLILSWASCSVEVASGQNHTYRCELKEGYQFPL